MSPNPAGRGPQSNASPQSHLPAASGAIPLQPQHLYKAVALFVLLLVLHSQFRPVAGVLLTIYAAAIVGVALNVLVGLVPRHRRLVSGVLGIVLFAGMGVSLWFGLPALGRQLRGLTEQMPRFEALLEQLANDVRNLTGLNIGLVGGHTRDVLASLFEGVEVVGTATGLMEALLLPVVILIGGLYAVAKPNERLLTPLLRVVPLQRRDGFRRMLELLGTRLNGWIKGTLLAMLAVGVLSGLGIWILGVRYALLLGVISGILEFVPFVGPWISGGISVGVALLDNPTTALWVALWMFAVQQIEANLISPLVMSKTTEIHPFVTLFALFFFGALFGFMGVVLAVPLVILVWTSVEVLWVEGAIHADRDQVEPVARE